MNQKIKLIGSEFFFYVENGEENLTKKNGLQNMKSGKDLDIQIEFAL